MPQPYASLLFWNTQGKTETAKILCELIEEHSIDIVALAESPVSSSTLALQLNQNTSGRFRSDLAGESSRITWAYRQTVSANPVFDGDKVSIREVQPPLGGKFIVCGIHASSRLARDVAELNVLLPRAASAIYDAEERLGYDRTVVLGDFNLSPFDDGLISSESFHAVMSPHVARRNSRVVYGQARKFFYNPMWKLMASDDLTCGTFYYSSNNPLEYFWHCYDQILLRPSMLESTAAHSIKFLTSAGTSSLIDERGIPRISDHLPIVAKLHIDISTVRSET